MINSHNGQKYENYKQVDTFLLQAWFWSFLYLNPTSSQDHNSVKAEHNNNHNNNTGSKVLRNNQYKTTTTKKTRCLNQHNFMVLSHQNVKKCSKIWLKTCSDHSESLYIKGVKTEQQKERVQRLNVTFTWSFMQWVSSVISGLTYEAHSNQFSRCRYV